MSADPAWSAAQRLEGLAGEVRINLIRLVALVAFYGHHLVNVFVIRDNPALQGAYHTVVTSLVLAWALAVLIIHYCLMRRWLPGILKYIVTAWDILLITTLLMVGGDGRSMLAVLYFLVIVAARCVFPCPWCGPRPSAPWRDTPSFWDTFVGDWSCRPGSGYLVLNKLYFCWRWQPLVCLRVNLSARAGGSPVPVEEEASS